MRRLLTLIFVAIIAFVGVFILRQCEGGGSMFEVFRSEESKGDVQYKRENYTLTDQPPLDLEDVEILSRLSDPLRRQYLYARG